MKFNYRKIGVLDLFGVRVSLVLSALVGVMNGLNIVNGVYGGAVEDEGGGGIMGQMRYFLGELGSLAQEVGTGVQKLSRQIRAVEEFLDATVDEDCYFQCPKGTQQRKRKEHVPKTNGCGSYGLEDYLNADYLPMEEFVECCNAHDICYETCGEDRDDCDIRFKKCLYSQCRAIQDSVSKLKFKGCQAGAKVLYTGTTAMGCKPYLEAQSTACDCVATKGMEL